MKPLNANGGATGNGGTITVEALGAASSVSLVTAGAGLSLTATGGSAGSAKGNGGTVIVEAGQNLSAPAGAGINVGVLGRKGTGGTISLAPLVKLA